MIPYGNSVFHNKIKVYNETMRLKQTLFTHLITSFRDAFRGLKITWHEERNFRIEVCIALAVVGALMLFDFSYIDVALAILAIVLVLAAEVVNTTFEDTLDKIEPEYDPIIGKIKDVAAGVVVLNVLGALAIGIVIIAHRFSL